MIGAWTVIGVPRGPMRATMDLSRFSVSSCVHANFGYLNAKAIVAGAMKTSDVRLTSSRAMRIVSSEPTDAGVANVSSGGLEWTNGICRRYSSFPSPGL